METAANVIIAFVCLHLADDVCSGGRGPSVYYGQPSPATSAYILSAPMYIPPAPIYVAHQPPPRVYAPPAPVYSPPTSVPVVPAPIHFAPMHRPAAASYVPPVLVSAPSTSVLLDPAPVRHWDYHKPTFVDLALASAPVKVANLPRSPSFVTPAVSYVPASVASVIPKGNTLLPQQKQPPSAVIIPNVQTKNVLREAPSRPQLPAEPPKKYMSSGPSLLEPPGKVSVRTKVTAAATIFLVKKDAKVVNENITRTVTRPPSNPYHPTRQPHPTSNSSGTRHPHSHHTRRPTRPVRTPPWTSGIYAGNPNGNPYYSLYWEHCNGQPQGPLLVPIQQVILNTVYGGSDFGMAFDGDEETYTSTTRKSTTTTTGKTTTRKFNTTTTTSRAATTPFDDQES